jgi:hypothetical protein
MTDQTPMTKKPTKEEVKAVIDDVDELDLPDGAHWALIAERLGIEYGDVFPIITSDPEFFGLEPLA